ncbi:hypothetical protein L210DRAFT_3486677 [Boletus edulis BED1]|uniref:F-box domain-containing protein n=1 Tax=Boletus edulis BED1 TaxID=1328754 RepID=A0AAD4BL03_BOLED|nr:hypothetical protein L210DRAFT_3486677 [Boletus edulis BED1]
METVALAVEEVMGQKSALSNFHAPWNAHPFIFRLPPEVLEDIFIQCASDYHCEHDGTPTSAAPSWVNVSYVCHHWRHVALNCATVWTYVFITSQRWTEELLARSRQASLKIRISLFNEFQFLNTVEKVMNHLDRIQELCVDVPALYDKQVLSKLSSRAPRLQTLQITLDDDPSLGWPSSLFAGVPPALHTLELSFCSVRLSSFKLNALTTLGLHDVPDRFRQHIEEFLAVMSYMKDLEHLYLDHALTSATGFLSSAVFRTFEKIDLPHLSRLLIGAPLSTTVALLSCVNIPSKTAVRLECDSEPDSPLDNYAVLCSLFTQRCSSAEDHALSRSTILSLDVDIFGLTAATLTFSPSERNFNDESDEVWDSNIPLLINLDLSENDGDRIISNICCSMSLSNVRSLRIIQPPFSSAFWRRMLGHLQDIRYIELHGANMPDLSVLSLADLTTDEGARNQDGLATGDRGQGHILAPSLEELVLEWITFLPEGDSDLPEPAITRHSLLDALSTRQGPHGRLTMTRCAIGNSDPFDSVMKWGDGGIHVVCDSENNEE